MSKRKNNNSNEVCCPKVEEIVSLREAQKMFGYRFQSDNWSHGGSRPMRDTEIPQQQQQPTTTKNK